MTLPIYDRLVVSHLDSTASPERENRLPLVVSPSEPGCSLEDCRPQLEAFVEDHLHRVGALLFRGFSSGGQEGFAKVVGWFTDSPLRYDYRSTPRTALGEGVYTSTEYPNHQTITLHNEMAYASSWPMKLWFYSDLVAETGGETPIADSRLIYERMPTEIRDRFESLGLMYVRNYRKDMDLTWQQTFNTEDREEVNAFCDEAGIEYEWNGDELKTKQYCQGVAAHPTTDDLVWFNQAHLFHHTNLDPESRQVMLDIYGAPEHMPRNVFYGDGSAIPDETLDRVRQVMDSVQVTFPWQEGDLMMLDNMLCAHGRKPFTGKRRVMVAMAESMQSDW